MKSLQIIILQKPSFTLNAIQFMDFNFTVLPLTVAKTVKLNSM